MARLSVLDMVQRTLSAMSSDAVNSISDTLESMQVAEIVREVYEEMMGRKNWPHLKKLISLTPIGAVRPTHLRVPIDIKELLFVSYDCRKETLDNPDYKELTWMEPSEFLAYTNRRNTDQTAVTSITDVTGVPILIRTDRAPQYYTSFDDEYLVFDAYNSGLETNLQESKTQCMAYVMPSFTLSDIFVPDLPTEMFPTLLAEVKSVAFVDVKQVANSKSEQQSRRGMGWASKKAFQIDGGFKFPDYGRKR